MLHGRRRKILRQLVRPPFVYRWVGLVTAMTVVVGLSAVAVSDRGRASVLAAGPTFPIAALAPSAPLAAVQGLDALAGPIISRALLSDTGNGERVVALTFDDGPHPEYTPQILRLLARYDAKATFCMIGEQARARPDLVRRVVAAGHRLCDHTITHDADVGERELSLMDRQIEASRDTVAAAAGPGVPLSYFRAPEGRWTPLLKTVVARHGMRPLGWSVDALDWTRPGVDEIVETVKREMHPGAVVLFHDGGGPREQTVAALARLLPWLEAQGYRFVLPR